MIPWLILGGVAFVFLIVVGGALIRKRRVELPTDETDADRERTEQEFEAADRYQEQWRKDHPDDDPIP